MLPLAMVTAGLFSSHIHLKIASDAMAVVLIRLEKETLPEYSHSILTCRLVCFAGPPLQLRLPTVQLPGEEAVRGAGQGHHHQSC